MRDSFGRIVNSLRISVTDRCNLRCTYCMPGEGMQWLNKDEILSYEEINYLVKVFADLGVNKIRLTGGEPLVRKDIYKLIFLISNIDEIDDISLTTNGYFLPQMAEQLYHAGLKRINISLDSLDPVKYNVITRRNYFHRVLEGVEKVIHAGFDPVKINIVVIRGLNDGELAEFAYLSRKTNLIIRFIEFMPIGSDDGWDNNKVVTYTEIIRRIEENAGLKLIPVPTEKCDPARRYSFEDGIGEIGFINSVSEPFCEHCNRIRLTAEGKLRTCLFSLNETDLKPLIRNGKRDRSKIRDLILRSVWNKEKGHLINKPDFIRPQKTMSQIGG